MRSCSSCRFFAEQSEHDGYCEQHNDLFSIGSCCSRWSSKELEKGECDLIITHLRNLMHDCCSVGSRELILGTIDKIRAIRDGK